uniref:Uncharacterized protein n=1 Tax=Oryza punctata TaxID=4537 RepID=A0A0E0LAP5_ORYPU
MEVVSRVQSPSWFTVDGSVAEETLLLPTLLLLGIPAEGAEEEDDGDDQARAALLRVEELEHLLGDVARRLSRLDAKRGRLEEQIAAASRGRRRHGSTAPTAAVVARPPPPAAGGSESEAEGYTRKGAGAVRKMLRAAGGDVKRARQWLEAVAGRLEAALVDAREQLALQQMLATGA